MKTNNNVEYVKGKPYFNDKTKKIKAYPYLNKNIECNVLIVGGGINGCIANYYFSNAGINTILIDKSKIAYTNTSCATALLEYQLDDFADDLKKLMSREDIIKIYNAGLKSLADINKIIMKHGNSCHYSPRDTLIYSIDKKDYKSISDEFNFRKNNGFNVKFFDKENNPFSFNLNAGLLAENGGAEFNPYLFTKLLVENRNKNSSRIFEHTEAKSIMKTSDGFKVLTSYGIEIHCKKIICSTGYNTTLFSSNKLCDKYISYTIVTNQLKDFSWANKTLLQDTEKPYHYLRTTHDNRIIIGGEDKVFTNDLIDENVAEKKYQKLFEYLIKLFPEIKDRVCVDYKFCGAFSSISNNVGVIGESELDKNIWYCLGYGANGILYAIYGAQMLVDKFNGVTNELESHFSPLRKLP